MESLVFTISVSQRNDAVLEEFMEDTNCVLDVQHLSVDFRMDRKTTLHAVKDISFKVKKGETLGILGESGCGKSVTCMSILQLNPTRTTSYPQGKILFEGKDLLKAGKRELQEIRGNRISQIFQEPMTAMNPLYTIGNQMMEELRIHHPHMEKADAYRQCAEELTKVGIPNPDRIMSSYPMTLSGGMLQRVMIAMAMLNRPELLICDEPTTALDVTIQAQVLDLMNSLKKESGTAIIFVTHDLGVISEMADRCMVMYGGKKCEEAPTEELFDNPHHPYTKGLINSHPDPSYTGSRLMVIKGSVPSLRNMPSGCPFHNRCDYADETCAAAFPEMNKVAEKHYAACYHADTGETS